MAPRRMRSRLQSRRRQAPGSPWWFWSRLPPLRLLDFRNYPETPLAQSQFALRINRAWRGRLALAPVRLVDFPLALFLDERDCAEHGLRRRGAQPQHRALAALVHRFLDPRG